MVTRSVASVISYTALGFRESFLKEPLYRYALPVKFEYNPIVPSPSISLRKVRMIRITSVRTFSSETLRKTSQKRAYLPVPAIQGQEYRYVYAFTNELGQKAAQEAFKKTSLQGNTFVGCSGLASANFASLKPGLNHIAIFDINEAIGRFWKDIQSILSYEGLTVARARERIYSYCSQDRSSQLCFLNELMKGESFMVSEERFRRIHQICLTGNISFRQLDMRDPKAVDAFFKTHQAQERIPDTVYLSNIASLIFASPDGQPHSTKHIDYKRFEKSITKIPLKAIVIDAREGLIKGEHEQRAIQRIHFTLESRKALMPPPCPCLYQEELMNDNYEGVMTCLRNGADPFGASLKGYTHLMITTFYHKNESMRALLDFMKENRAGELELFVNAQDIKGRSALHFAASVDNARGIQLLLDHGADILLETY